MSWPGCWSGCSGSSSRSACSTRNPACSMRRPWRPVRSEKTGKRQRQQNFRFHDNDPFGVRSDRHARRGAQTHEPHRGLNSQVVFEAENRDRRTEARRQFASAGSPERGAPHPPASCSHKQEQPLPGSFAALRAFCLFRNLLGALRRRAALHSAIRARTAGHIAAVHDRRQHSVSRSHRHHPHHRHSQCQPPAHAGVLEARHRLILASIRATRAVIVRHCFTGSRYMPPPPSRRTGRTICGVITIASSATSMLLFLLVRVLKSRQLAQPRNSRDRVRLLSR